MLTIVAPTITGRNGGGRKKGTPNKINADIRAMVLEALDDVGGPRYLSRQAKENPVAFMGLLGKILPTTIANSDGSPIALHLIAAQLVSKHILELQAEPSHIQTSVATPVDTQRLLDAPPPEE
jgi:hypothetical protein